MRLVVSPHYDDAVLGCGSYLAESHDTILTVMAGAPAPPLSTEYDRAAGFADSDEALQARRLEDVGARTRLGCDGLEASFLDLQYGLPPRVIDVMRAVAETAKGADGIVAPLGLQHPDHVLVSDACLRAADYLGTPLWLYEELPYRVVWPELVWQRLEGLRLCGRTLHPDFIGGGPTTAKRRAIGCYRSQDVDLHCCLVPERFWRVVG